MCLLQWISGEAWFQEAILKLQHKKDARDRGERGKPDPAPWSTVSQVISRPALTATTTEDGYFHLPGRSELALEALRIGCLETLQLNNASIKDFLFQLIFFRLLWHGPAWEVQQKILPRFGFDATKVAVRWKRI